MASFMKEFEHLKIQLQDIKNATNSFDNEIIGKGGFGVVYKGEVSHSKGRNIVAIKRLDRQFGQGDPEFLKEIVMLSRYTHQNLISLLGYCDEDGEKILVYEFAANGSLDQRLSDPGLTWTQRLKICIGAARALSFLHVPNGTYHRVLHCDIKSANILLDECLNAKVSDFGLAKLGPANQQCSFLFTNARGTPGYCDPQYMMTYALTKESDIYSFGVVLFEVLCGRLCFELSRGQLTVFVTMWKQSYTEKKLKEIIFQDLIQQMDPNSLEIFSDIAFQCLQNSREERPTISYVVKKLELALKSQEIHDNNAPFSEDLSGTAGLSLNIANHEPAHWEFFTKLARDEFSRKDNVSLIDQDHPAFSSKHSKVKEASGSELESEDSFVDAEETKRDATLITWSESETSYDPSQGEIGESLQFAAMVENMRMAYSEYETYVEDAGLPSNDLSEGDFEIGSLRIIRNEDLKELRELGSNKFETVYHGKWRGTNVAIKRINKSCFADQSSDHESLTVELWREATIWSKLHHPNIAAFYGVVQDGPGGALAIVTELIVNGSLRHVLIRKDRLLDRRKRLMIALDVATGMEYLHSKNIVHFDLKCDNLLVDMKDPSRLICKVDNFGQSKMKRNNLVSGGVTGTLPWMAPELLNGSSSKVSEKVDVFSFGIVLWEILTGEEPYANMHYGEIIGGIASNTLRPPIPNYCDGEWRKLMERCWTPNPIVRPSFTEITQQLRVMSAE